MSALVVVVVYKLFSTVLELDSKHSGNSWTVPAVQKTLVPSHHEMAAPLNKVSFLYLTTRM